MRPVAGFAIRRRSTAGNLQTRSATSRSATTLFRPHKAGRIPAFPVRRHVPNPQYSDPVHFESQARDDKQLSAADVTLAVMNFNGADKLPALFDSIARLERAPGAVMIVDDGSTDGGAEMIRQQYPDVRIASMGGNTKILNRVRNGPSRKRQRSSFSS